MRAAQPSVLKATLPYAVPAWLAASAFVLIGGLDPVALFLALAALTTFWAPQVAGAYRVRKALERFATGVPGSPQASTSVLGPMTLTWPGLDLEVEGHRLVFWVHRLVVRVGDDAYVAGPEGAGDLGRRAARHAQAGTSPGQLL